MNTIHADDKFKQALLDDNNIAADEDLLKLLEGNSNYLNFLEENFDSYLFVLESWKTEFARIFNELLEKIISEYLLKLNELRRQQGFASWHSKVNNKELLKQYILSLDNKTHPLISYLRFDLIKYVSEDKHIPILAKSIKDTKVRKKEQAATATTNDNIILIKGKLAAFKAAFFQRASQGEMIAMPKGYYKETLRKLNIQLKQLEDKEAISRSKLNKARKQLSNKLSAQCTTSDRGRLTERETFIYHLVNLTETLSDFKNKFFKNVSEKSKGYVAVKGCYSNCIKPITIFEVKNDIIKNDGKNYYIEPVMQEDALKKYMEQVKNLYDELVRWRKVNPTSIFKEAMHDITDYFAGFWGGRGIYHDQVTLGYNVDSLLSYLAQFCNSEQKNYYSINQKSFELFSAVKEIELQKNLQNELNHLREVESEIKRIKQQKASIVLLPLSFKNSASVEKRFLREQSMQLVRLKKCC